MLFTLAGHLSKTVAWLERNLSMRELMEWITLSGMEPIGATRMDANAGAIVAEIRSAMRGLAGVRDPVRLSECMLDWSPKPERAPGEPPKPKKTVEQMKAIMAAALHANNEYLRLHRRGA